jgi:hypothetical protein
MDKNILYFLLLFRRREEEDEYGQNQKMKKNL